MFISSKSRYLFAILLCLSLNLQARTCDGIKEEEYRTTIAEFISSGFLKLSPELFTRYVNARWQPLETAFDSTELNMLNLLGLSYVSHTGAARKKQSYFEITDTLRTAITKLSGKGKNSGEIKQILENLLACYPAIDSYKLLPRVSPLIYMNTFGVHGSMIRKLYRDVCSKDLTCMAKLLLATNQGLISIQQLHAQIQLGTLTPENKRHLDSAMAKVTKVIATIKAGKITSPDYSDR